MQKYIKIKNFETVDFEDIPSLSYEDFLKINVAFLKLPSNHCVNYFAIPSDESLIFVCCIANDSKAIIKLSKCIIPTNEPISLASFSALNFSFSMFEREISEQYGVKYIDHPWLKPLRYSFDRTNKFSTIENYPFYSIDSEELHEVGVGPIHAGIIEPGHFRFICKGEQIINLEIQLGYQHRGIENEFSNCKDLSKLNLLAETINGDTTVGHSVAFASLWNSLCGVNVPEDLQFVRTLALELERIANHTGDLSAICGDIAYQLGASVFGRLRTPIINYFQAWCGNRFAKSLIKADRCYFPFTDKLKNLLVETLDNYEKDFNEMCDKFMHDPGCLLRLEKTGVFTYDQALKIGAVGMAARASALKRDIRFSHPDSIYSKFEHIPVIKHHGDVYSRTQIRVVEIKQSIKYIRQLIDSLPNFSSNYLTGSSPKKNSFSISLVEGWRGEICHCALTDNNGNLKYYKVKDPSFHNWLALSIAVKKNDISDFPICNKSFNLSYCGFDL